MKHKILSIGILLIIMALLPVVAVKYSYADDNSRISSSTDDSVSINITNKNDKNKILCGLVAGEYKESYCDETIKAIAILINTDYDVNPDSFDVNDSEACIFEENADNSLKEKYSEIQNIFNSVSEIKIFFDKNIRYIPYSDSSNGSTIPSEEYSYLCSVASPWDCYSENYSEDVECIGVSLNGIDYLCRNGANAEEALKWYLPGCEIE